MKIAFAALCCLTSLAGLGQDPSLKLDGSPWKAPYNLVTPFGWGVERSAIKVDFAAQGVVKGLEDIRYTPGWGNPESDQYWSYGILWYLDGSLNINEESIEKNLNTRYTELLRKNAESQNIPAGKILPVKAWITELDAEGIDSKTYYGAVAMTDYMSRKPISLNCIVHVKIQPEQDKTFLFLEFSPQALNDKIWKNLDQLWLDSDFTVSEHKPRLTLKTACLPEPVFGGG